VFAIDRHFHFHPGLKFAGEVEAFPSGALASPTYIRLGWKWLTVVNGLAYYAKELTAAVKSFVLQAPDEKSIKQCPESSNIFLANDP